MEMTSGNLWKKILLYSLPLVMTNLLQLLFNIADVAIVGKFAGSISLGAVGSTTLLVSLTTGWVIGIANGVNAVVAYYAGAKEKEGERKSINLGFYICLIVGLLTLALGVILARPVLTLLGTKDELIEEAVLYFKIYMLGSPALALFNYGNSVLSAKGDTKKPLKILLTAGVINVILNLLFVIGLKMTADGVAIASIVSQYISAALVLMSMVREKQQYMFEPLKVKFDLIVTGKIVKIGIPSAIQYSLFAVANLFVQSAVNTFDHVIVEGNSAAMNFDAVVYEMMAAFYVACTSFIAQNYGCNNKVNVKKTYLITTVYSFGLAAVLGALIHVFRCPLLFIFTNDVEVVEAGAIRLGILSITYCLSAFMDNATAACRGLGETVVPTVAIIMGTIVFRVVWIYTVFAYFGTLESIYILYGCAFVITALFENWYFARLYKRKFTFHLAQ